MPSVPAFAGDGTAPAGVVSPWRRVVTLARRLPVTVALISVIVVMGVATRALWDPLGSRAAVEVFG